MEAMVWRNAKSVTIPAVAKAISGPSQAVVTASRSFSWGSTRRIGAEELETDISPLV
jgi:hypothetical protein